VSKGILHLALTNRELSLELEYREPADGASNIAAPSGASDSREREGTSWLEFCRSIFQTEAVEIF
jgi:hypothetical protein